MTGLEFLGDKSGDGLVPTVDPSDLKKAWTMTQDVLANHGPNELVGIGQSVYASACSPGANPMAVWYRASMLRLLADQVGLLTPKMPGEVRDVVFDVASKYPMKKLEPGVVYDGFPFDLHEFMKQIGDELRQRGYKV